MKTIKKNDEIKRISDKEAPDMIGKGWKYCPKSEWKSIKKNKKG
jgi:hypothetical protein